MAGPGGLLGPWALPLHITRQCGLFPARTAHHEDPYTRPRAETLWVPRPPPQLPAPPPCPPAGLLAQLPLWPTPRASSQPCASAPPSLLFVFSSRKESSCHSLQLPRPLPLAWKGPTLPRGLGDTCLLPVPLCWPGPGGGREAGQCALSVPDPVPGVRGCPAIRGRQDAGWIGQKPVIRAGVRPAGTFGAGTPLL